MKPLLGTCFFTKHLAVGGRVEHQNETRNLKSLAETVRLLCYDAFRKLKKTRPISIKIKFKPTHTWGPFLFQ